MELGLSLPICKVNIMIIPSHSVVVRITEVKNLLESGHIGGGQINDSEKQKAFPQRATRFCLCCSWYGRDSLRPRSALETLMGCAYSQMYGVIGRSAW